MIKKNIFDKISDYDALEIEIDELLAEREELTEKQEEIYTKIGQYPKNTICPCIIKTHRELINKFEIVNNRLLEIELKLEELYELEPKI